MRPKDLTGKTFTVVDASPYRMLLEVDNATGLESNKFVLVVPEAIEGNPNNATLEFTELKK